MAKPRYKADAYSKELTALYDDETVQEVNRLGGRVRVARVDLNPAEDIADGGISALTLFSKNTRIVEIGVSVNDTIACTLDVGLVDAEGTTDIGNGNTDDPAFFTTSPIDLSAGGVATILAKLGVSSGQKNVAYLTGEKQTYLVCRNNGGAIPADSELYFIVYYVVD